MEAEKLDEHLSPAMATVKSTRRRGREVSSRYMIPPSPRSIPSSSIHLSSTSSSIRKQINNQKTLVPTVPSSRDASYSDSKSSSRYADENQHSFVTPLPSIMQGKGQNAHKRCVIRSLSDNSRDTSLTQNVELHNGRPNIRVGTPIARDCGLGTPRSVLYSQTEFRSMKKTANHEGRSKAVTHFPLKNSCSSVDSGIESCQISVQEMCNLGKVFSPPQPPSSRLGLDMKKGKKGSRTKEDVRVLYLLHNQYLQWRFVNAAAESAVKARINTAERSLFEVAKKLKVLRDSVIEKRMELEKLLRLRKLFNIVDAEMSYLEEWALMDAQYSDSLSGTIKALKDASIRLPVIGDVRVDVRELKESIHSASSMFESFSSSIERLLPKANGVAKEMSELAKVVRREKALIKECGDLISEVQRLQVKECSLRSMLMQVKSSSII